MSESSANLTTTGEYCLYLEQLSSEDLRTVFCVINFTVGISMQNAFTDLYTLYRLRLKHRVILNLYNIGVIIQLSCINTDSDHTNDCQLFVALAY
jgi:hypothetical protein